MESVEDILDELYLERQANMINEGAIDFQKLA